MTINEAKNIAISDILAHLGYTIEKRTDGGREIWYTRNPLREENTVSLSVNIEKNVWYDLGTGKGGDSIDFVKEYLGKGTYDALRWLHAYVSASGSATEHIFSQETNYEEKSGRFKVFSVKKIYSTALKEYLLSRCIQPDLASFYLSQVHFIDSTKGKKYFGLGFQNESDGFEIRNPLGFKGCVGHKDITFIQGDESSGRLHVFEGVYDFLSFLEIQKKSKPPGKVIVLNSTNMARRAVQFIHQLVDLGEAIDDLVLYFDNETSGSQAAVAVETAKQHFLNLKCPVYSAQINYEAYHDLNDYWKDTRSHREFVMAPA
jgi:hypothetical protein